jgi:hypothetical protein
MTVEEKMGSPRLAELRQASFRTPNPVIVFMNTSTKLLPGPKRRTKNQDAEFTTSRMTITSGVRKLKDF